MMQYIVAISFMVLANAMYIMGMYIAGTYEEGDEARDHENILGSFHRWVRSKVGVFWTKPIIGCPVCMASVHSSYVYLPVVVLYSVPWYLAVILFPAYVCIVSATVGIINRIING